MLRQPGREESTQARGVGWREIISATPIISNLVIRGNIEREVVLIEAWVLTVNVSGGVRVVRGVSDGVDVN